MGEKLRCAGWRGGLAERVLDAVPGGVLVVDADGCVVYANARAGATAR